MIMLTSSPFGPLEGNAIKARNGKLQRVSCVGPVLQLRSCKDTCANDEINLRPGTIALLSGMPHLSHHRFLTLSNCQHGLHRRNLGVANPSVLRPLIHMLEVKVQDDVCN